jgi:hypothetical protein
MNENSTEIIQYLRAKTVSVSGIEFLLKAVSKTAVFDYRRAIK